MGHIIKRDVIKREKGKLYYIDKPGNLCEADMQNMRSTRKKIDGEKKSRSNKARHTLKNKAKAVTKKYSKKKK